jgi:hypothetical protein
VRLSGVLRDLAGQPLTGAVDVHFAIYKDEADTAAIWGETQTLQLDEHGRYTVLLGATQPEGLPLLLFESTEARWLGVSAGKLPEQPRILLVSVPYALKASDADTLGGKPASAYVTTDAASNSSGQSQTAGTTSAQGQAAIVGLPAQAAASNPSTAVGGSGNANFLPIWTNGTTLGNSTLYETDGKVGIGNSSPAGTLDVSGGAFIRGTLQLPASKTATKTSGFSSNPLDMQASAFNSGTSAAVAQLFRWQAEAVGNDTTSPSGKLNLLFASAPGNPAETGLSISSSGNLTVAGALLPAAGAATAAKGYNSNPVDLQASSFNSGTSAAVAQLFRWQAEPAGNDTASPSGTLNLLYLAGTGTPAETGLSIASNGLLSFASGQTFPGTGTGTVTSVGSGAGLTGGPITTSGTLSIATAGVTNAMLANPSLTVKAGTGLSGGGSVALGGSTSLSIASGAISNSMLANPSLTVTAGTDLTGGGSVALGSSVALNLDTTKVPTLGATSNTFTGSIAATSFSGSGAGLTSLNPANLSTGTAGINISGNAATATAATTAATATNALSLGGVVAANYARLDIPNSFTGNQSVTGNVSATGSVSGGTASFGGALTAAGAVLPATDTATATQGFTSNPIDLQASSFNSGTSAAVPQMFRWQAEPAGNDTASPSATLNLLYLSGSGTPAETGLSIASNGRLTFAAGQTFPGGGGGTITGVTAGTDLTGGGTSGTVTLNLDTTKVPTLAAASNTFTGSIAANSFSGSGSALTNLNPANLSAGTAAINISGIAATATNATALGGLAATAFAQLGAANTFTATQTISSGDVAIGSGNLDLPQTTSGSVGMITMGGGPFIHACCSFAQNNTFVGGSAGSAGVTGSSNTATGTAALSSITTGSQNTATGDFALYLDTTGGSNTATGHSALTANNGSWNTATGSLALNSNSTGSNNTATGNRTLQLNDAGSNNAAVGACALLNTTRSGSSQACGAPTPGNADANTAVGTLAGKSNATGNSNTFVGFQADAGSGNLTNATAIGANALVSESNALVLGGTGGNAVSVGIGTATPAYTLDVQGTGNFTGMVKFTSGQTFPGTGTVTGVGSGAGLTGGPIFTFGTLSIASGGVTNNMLANPALSVKAGTDLTGGGSVALGSSVTLNVDTTQIPQLAAANTFTNDQTIDGTLDVSNSAFTGMTVSSSSTQNSAAAIDGEMNGSNGTFGPNTYAVYGYDHDTSSTGVGVAGQEDGSGYGVWGKAGSGFGVTGVTGASNGNWAVYGLGNIGASGTVGGNVEVDNGSRQVALYGIQAPEVWFEDYGSGQLASGAVAITLEPVFLQTVNTSVEYHVFLTPKGDCEGLYVTNETATGFEVRELHHGSSSVAFDYRIVAKRKGYETTRLSDVTTEVWRAAEKSRSVPPRRPASVLKDKPPLVHRPTPATNVVRGAGS